MLVGFLKLEVSISLLVHEDSSFLVVVVVLDFVYLFHLGETSVHLTILSEQMLGKYRNLEFRSFLRTSMTLVECARGSVSLVFLCLVVHCARIWMFTTYSHPTTLLPSFFSQETKVNFFF